MNKEKFIPQRGEIAEFRVLPHNAPVERVFIDMTADGMYLSWNAHKTTTQRWFHATPIKKPLFTNSLDEEFYEGDDGYYYWKHGKNIHYIHNIKGKNTCKEGSQASEVYKTEETAEEMLRRYNIEQEWGNGGNLQVFLDETQLSKGYWTNIASYQATKANNSTWKPNWNEYDYRIKPEAEPEYVPFTMDDITDELLCKGVKNKATGKVRLFGSLSLDDHNFNWYFREFTFLDESPVGKAVKC